ILLMLPSAVLEIVMIARGQYRLASACYGVSDTLRAAFFLVPVLLLGWRIEGLLLGAIAFAALRLAATLGYVARAVPPAEGPTRGRRGTARGASWRCCSFPSSDCCWSARATWSCCCSPPAISPACRSS